MHRKILINEEIEDLPELGRPLTLGGRDDGRHAGFVGGGPRVDLGD